MKVLKIALFTVYVMMLSVITFYSFSLIFTVVANHQALDLVSLAGLPMVFLMCSLIVVLVAGYRYVVRKQNDAFMIRQYSILVLIFAFFGLASSIIAGTLVYHSFVKDYIFKCYPLILTIIHAIMLGGSIYLVITSQIEIKNGEDKLQKIPALYQVRSFGIGVILLFALNRLGAFILMPYYWSDIDGVITLPYLFQLLMPSVILITYLLHEDFLKSRKVTMALSYSVLAYSTFSLIYMILMSKGNYPTTINSLSAIQLFERLVCYPIDAYLLYGVSFLLAGLNAFNNTLMTIKENKKKNN